VQRLASNLTANPTEELDMHRTALAVAVLAIVALAAACGEDPAADAPIEPPAGTEDDLGEDTVAGEAHSEIVGTFGGDAQLEGGCAWIDADDGTRYEVQYPPDHQVTFEPLQLTGPDGGVLAEEGDILTVRGELAEDMVSFCQVGPIFTAAEVILDS
jgi:hypothetical protein